MRKIYKKIPKHEKKVWPSTPRKIIYKTKYYINNWKTQKKETINWKHVNQMRKIQRNNNKKKV